MTPLLVLIVDDDARNRKLARDVLAFDGIDTLEAATAGEAIALVRERGPHLVLLDLRLPDLDGTETLRRLRADPANEGMKVVAVTALADAADALLGAGFDGYVPKPIDALSFAARVRELAAGAGPRRGWEASTLDGRLDE